MNPATPGTLTILLVPPADDVALLADEAGGTMPTAYRHEGGPWFLTHDEAMAWHISDDPRGIFVQPEHRALVLVNQCAPVAMGCDRVLRVDYAFRDWISLTYTVEAALRFARAYVARHPGARVVLMRDGREVES